MDSFEKHASFLEENKELYDDEIKAKLGIFVSIPTLDLGAVKLRGFYTDQIEVESKYYFFNSNDELVKKYLPNCYVNNIEEATVKIYDLCKKFLFKVGISFCIAIKETNVPIGYVIVNSPRCPFSDKDKMPRGEWTLDFFLGAHTRGRSIMSTCVFRVLSYLQQMSVPIIYAYVDESNTNSIRVLQRNQFKLVGQSSDDKLIYGALLN